ncbi:MAG: hypothetical protein WC852_02965 [Candidatus Nanoarchaeia archaeon]|jgi:hypothetical protein
MKATLVEVMENGSEEKFDARSHSATVFYSGFGGGGSSSPSSMGGGGFGSSSSSSMGSGGRSSSDYSKPDYMGGVKSKDPDYMGLGSRSNPCGPLSQAVEIQIKPIEIDIAPAVYKPMELDMPKLDTGLLCKALENMDLPKVPSNIGSAGMSRETSSLLEFVTRGHYNPPSTLGSGGSRLPVSLGEGLELRGTRNTAIIKEPLGEGFNLTYSYHDRGYGRCQLDLKLPGTKGRKICDIFKPWETKDD